MHVGGSRDGEPALSTSPTLSGLWTGMPSTAASTILLPMQTKMSSLRSAAEWLHRVRTNGLHYKYLYAIVFLACLVYTILSSPLLLFGMLMLLVGW